MLFEEIKYQKKFKQMERRDKKTVKQAALRDKRNKKQVVKQMNNKKDENPIIYQDKNSYKEIGLVLSGGGARGAYQIGVWKALKELNLIDYIGAVSGTSVGALNSALFSIMEYEEAYELWTNLNQDDIMPIDLNLNKKMITLVQDYIDGLVNDLNLANIMHKLVPLIMKNSAKIGIGSIVSTSALAALGIAPALLTPQIIGLINFVISVKPTLLSLSDYEGLIKKDKLKLILDNNVSNKHIQKSGVDVYACCTPFDYNDWFNKNNLKPEYFKLNNYDDTTVKKILSASSAIPVIFEHEEMFNNKYMDGCVVDNTPIEPLIRQGYKKIIVVYLNEKPKRINRKKYEKEDCKIIEVIPSKEANCKASIVSTTKFDSELAKERINLGYQDALISLKQIIISKGRLPSK